MFNYITGTLTESGDGYVVVECGGIGYTIYTTNTTTALLRIGEEVKVYTYLYLREGIMDLYGFSTAKERDMFLSLISISGVGPKAAISVLSIAPVETLIVAIVTGDVNLIKTAQGVGPKAAQRIVMELKDKLKSEDIHINSENMPSAAESGSKDEALSALVVLGYSAAQARAALSGIDGTLDTESIIKLALRSLS